MESGQQLVLKGLKLAKGCNNKNGKGLQLLSEQWQTVKVIKKSKVEKGY